MTPFPQYAVSQSKTCGTHGICGHKWIVLSREENSDHFQEIIQWTTKVPDIHVSVLG